MAQRAGAKKKPDLKVVENRVLTPDHNEVGLTAEEKADLFLVHLAQARKDNDTLEQAMEVVRGVRKVRNRNRSLCHSDGFGLKHLDEILRDEGMDRDTREKDAALRTMMRRAAGMPVLGEAQLDLFAQNTNVPDAIPDTIDQTNIRLDGYNAGLRGLEATPPEWVAPDDHQTWLEEWGRGQTRIAEAMATKKKIDERRGS